MSCDSSRLVSADNGDSLSPSLWCCTYSVNAPCQKAQSHVLLGGLIMQPRVKNIGGKLVFSHWVIIKSIRQSRLCDDLVNKRFVIENPADPSCLFSKALYNFYKALPVSQIELCLQMSITFTFKTRYLCNKPNNFLMLCILSSFHSNIHILSKCLQISISKQERIN